MQTVVDFQGIFTDVCIGWSGCVHDARMFSNSGILRKRSNEQLFQNYTRTINGHNLPFVIVGDPAYPLLPWLIKLYQDYVGMSQKQRHFNFRLRKARITVKHPFGRLKSRLALFAKTHRLPPGQCAHVIAACVMLHNICETLGDRYQDDWVVQENANAAVDERGSRNDNHNGAAGTGHGTPTSRAIRNGR